MKRSCFLVLLSTIWFTSCEKLQIETIVENATQQEKPKYSVTPLMRLSAFGADPFSSSAQGMDIYDDRVLFQAGLSDNIIHVIDFDEFTWLGSISFVTPDNELSHMNNINCGNKYSDLDLYPLLYVSQTSNSHSCFVLRLANDISSYDLIQTINYIGSQHHAGSNYDWFIDISNQYIFTYGKHNKLLEEREIVRFPFPSLNNSVVSFTDEDVIDSFVLENMSIYQGSRIIDGLLYAPVGFGNKQYPGHLKIIDLDNKTLMEDIVLNCGEPESIGRYKEGAIICGGGKDPYYYFIQL